MSDSFDDRIIDNDFFSKILDLLPVSHANSLVPRKIGFSFCFCQIHYIVKVQSQKFSYICLWSFHVVPCDAIVRFMWRRVNVCFRGRNTELILLASLYPA